MVSHNPPMLPANALFLCNPQGGYLPPALQDIVAKPFHLVKNAAGAASGHYSTDTAVKLVFLGDQLKKEWVVANHEDGVDRPLLTTTGHPDCFLVFADSSGPPGYNQAWYTCSQHFHPELYLPGVHFSPAMVKNDDLGVQLGSMNILLAIQQSMAEQKHHFMTMEAESSKRTNAVMEQFAAQQQQQQEMKRFSESTRDMIYETKKDVREKFADMEEKLDRMQNQLAVTQQPPQQPLVVYLVRSSKYVNISLGAEPVAVKWSETKGTHSVYMTCDASRKVCEDGYTYVNLSRNPRRASQGLVDFEGIWEGHLMIDERPTRSRPGPY